MAANAGAKACSFTLSGTTADTVNFTRSGGSLIVTNRHATEMLWVRLDGTTAVAAADENYAVPAGTSLTLSGGKFGGNQTRSVVGNGNTVTVGIF